jgi:A/G-specific adenine glycosylase
MMELGATVCTPASPGCSRCPLVTLCRARANDAVEQHPAPKTKKRPRAVDAVALLVERDGKLLLVRRPPTRLWGGLWEPPWKPVAASERAPDATIVARVAKGCIGLALADIQSVGTYDHVLTHRHMRFHVFAARGRGRVKLDGWEAARWQTRAAALDAGVAAWTRRLLQKELG